LHIKIWEMHQKIFSKQHFRAWGLQHVWDYFWNHIKSLADNMHLPRDYGAWFIGYSAYLFRNYFHSQAYKIRQIIYPDTHWNFALWRKHRSHHPMLRPVSRIFTNVNGNVSVVFVRSFSTTNGRREYRCPSVDDNRSWWRVKALLAVQTGQVSNLSSKRHSSVLLVLCFACSYRMVTG